MDLIKIEARNGIDTVNARELHEFIESKRNFSDWIKQRIEKFNFKENIDYVKVSQISETLGGKQKTIEYYLSVNMAKELSMIENNDKGRQARQYFIDCEKKLTDIKNKDMAILNIIQDMIKQNQQFQLQMLSELKNITSTINNNILLAPAEKEKISVVEYVKKNKIFLRSDEFGLFVKNVGRQCSDLSRQLQRTIQYKKEGNWNVGYYDVDIVKNCVENYILVKERNKTIFDF